MLKPGDDKIYEIKPIGYTATFDRETNPIKLYPNPATTQVQIQIPNDWRDLTMQITNTEGKLYYKSTLNTFETSKVTVDTDTFPNGMYILQLQTQKQTFVTKLIITK